MSIIHICNPLTSYGFFSKAIEGRQVTTTHRLNNTPGVYKIIQRRKPREAHVTQPGDESEGRRRSDLVAKIVNGMK